MTSFPSSFGMTCARACGSDTSTPVWIIGAATMKITSSTSMTSTRGVTLMSASMPPPPPPDDMAIALPQEVTLHDVEEVVGEGLHLRRQHLGLAGEVVERHDRRDGGDQADRRRDERLGHARRDGGEVRRALG